MVERFPDEFVTWHHKTPIGVKVDEVFGMDSKSGKVWLEFAKQIYSEQGTSDYREINHFQDGVPFLEGYPGRISITHTNHFLAVAYLPKTPEISLDIFNPRTAMGIDAEPLDRVQVLKVRSKFISAEEELLVPENNLEANILAWTIKEAVYKASVTPGVDLKENIRILELPAVAVDPNSKDCILGKAILTLPAPNPQEGIEMRLFSYKSYGCCVTIALSSKCARFGG